MPHFQWLKWYSKPTNNSGNFTSRALKNHYHYEVIKQNNYENNQHLLKPETKRRFAPHGVRLTLVNVTKKDEGKYTCLVGNSVGYDVTHTYVIVREFPRLGKLQVYVERLLVNLGKHQFLSYF